MTGGPSHERLAAAKMSAGLPRRGLKRRAAHLSAYLVLSPALATIRCVAGKETLARANRDKNDEFYTQLVDIEGLQHTEGRLTQPSRHVRHWQQHHHKFAAQHMEPRERDVDRLLERQLMR